MDTISMKELAEILNIFAPIHFNTGLFKDKMIGILLMLEDEIPAGIHLDDLEVEQFVNKYKSNFSYDMKEIEKLLRIKFTFKKNIPSVFYASFMLLHEEGHWVDLIERFNNDYKLNFEKYNNEKVNSKYLYYLNLAEAENSDVLKHLYFLEASKEYRRLTLEKSADDYAIKKLNDKIVTINEIVQNYKPPLTDNFGRPIL